MEHRLDLPSRDMASTYNDRACCICAAIVPSEGEINEKVAESKASPPGRLQCCSRLICHPCLVKQPRFQTYCPYCQMSFDEASVLPRGGLRDPPGYSTHLDTIHDQQAPPSYDASQNEASEASSSKQDRDVLHYLHPYESIQSLSLAYRVPQSVLRKHNSIFTDGLLAARRTINIPAEYYKGESLSPTPVEDPEETERKSKIRRFMILTKCHKYDVAEIYLKNSQGDVDAATETWKADEIWEKQNPLGSRRNKALRNIR